MTSQEAGSGWGRLGARGWLALAAFLAVAISLATPLYDPLVAGRDDTWALLVMVTLVQLGVALLLPPRWALATPIALSVAGFLAGGAEGLAWMALVLLLPVLLVVAALGAAIRSRRPDAGAWLGLTLLAIAFVTPAWALVETLRRGPPLPQEIEATLPTELSLANLCPGTATGSDMAADLERRGQALVDQVRIRPQAVVAHALGSDEERTTTVRELAEEHLRDMRTHGPSCDSALRRRLQQEL